MAKNTEITVRRCPECQASFSSDSPLHSCPVHNIKLVEMNLDPFIGYLLADRYKIISTLASGGSGDVYLAEQIGLERKVAVKFLSKHLADDENRVKRFEQEAKVLAQLKHPGIVQVIDTGLKPQPYIVMEWIESESATFYTKAENQLSDLQIILVYRSLLQSLSYAHKLDIIHRDIKPENIKISVNELGEPESKLLDFGLSKLLAQASNLTKTGESFGTPTCMSPEQCLGHIVDARSDIYSLACTIYELISGKLPFEEESYAAYFSAHCNKTVPPLPVVDKNNKLLNGLYKIVYKSLAKDPNKRFQATDEIILEIDKLLQGVNISNELSNNLSPRHISSPKLSKKKHTSYDNSFGDMDPKRKNFIALFCALIIISVGISCVWLFQSTSTSKIVPKIVSLNKEQNKNDVMTSVNQKPDLSNSSDENERIYSSIVFKEEIWRKDFEGHDLKVQIYKPKNIEQGKKLPTILFVHQFHQTKNAFAWLKAQWAKQGYFVLSLHPSVSTTVQDKSKDISNALSPAHNKTPARVGFISGSNLLVKDFIYVFDRIESLEKEKNSDFSNFDLKKLGIVAVHGGALPVIRSFDFSILNNKQILDSDIKGHCLGLFLISPVSTAATRKDFFSSIEIPIFVVSTRIEANSSRWDKESDAPGEFSNPPSKHKFLCIFNNSHLADLSGVSDRVSLTKDQLDLQMFSSSFWKAVFGNSKEMNFLEHYKPDDSQNNEYVYRVGK